MPKISENAPVLVRAGVIRLDGQLLLVVDARGIIGAFGEGNDDEGGEKEAEFGKSGHAIEILERR